MKIGVVGKREFWNPMGCTGALCKYSRQDALSDAIAVAALEGIKTPR